MAKFPEEIVSDLKQTIGNEIFINQHVDEFPKTQYIPVEYRVFSGTSKEQPQGFKIIVFGFANSKKPSKKIKVSLDSLINPVVTFRSVRENGRSSQHTLIVAEKLTLGGTTK
ncbi:hypothetical protein RyT2_26510 [Pseudolactococcus yaeyamensis]